MPCFRRRIYVRIAAAVVWVALLSACEQPSVAIDRLDPPTVAQVSYASAENLLTTEQHTFVGEPAWVPEGNTVVEHVRTPSFVDDGSLRIVVSRSGPWPDPTRTARTGTLPRGQGVAASPGVELRGSVRVKSDSIPTNARCEVRFYNSIGKGRIIETAKGPLTAVEPERWTPLTCSSVAPAGTTQASLRIFIDDVDYGDTFLADDAWLTAQDGRTSLPTEAAPAPEESRESEPPAERTLNPTPIPETSASSDPRTLDGDTRSLSANDAPASWSAAWSTRDYSTIRSWYRKNTGIAAGGFTETDLERSGSIRTTSHGQLIEKVRVDGSITVEHNDVTIRNVMVINDGGTIPVNVPYGSGVDKLTLENISLIGTGGSAKYYQAVGATYLRNGLHASRVYISGFGGGFRLSHRGSDQVDLSMVENIRIHPGSHNTGVSFRGGSGKSIARSWIEGSTSSALSLYPDVEPIAKFEARQNVFDGGTYSIHGGDDKAYGSQTSAAFVDNLFTRSHQYGPLTAFTRSRPDRVWSGNAYVDGTPID